MRVQFKQLGRHRVGDALVNVESLDEVHDVLHAEDLDRYTAGVHYVIRQEPPAPSPEQSTAPSPEQPAEPSPESNASAERPAAETAGAEKPEADPAAAAAAKPKGGRGAGARE